jgi:hypothetical protein
MMDLGDRISLCNVFLTPAHTVVPGHKEGSSYELAWET